MPLIACRSRTYDSAAAPDRRHDRPERSEIILNWATSIALGAPAR
jgi:hypothetical protein